MRGTNQIQTASANAQMQNKPRGFSSIITMPSNKTMIEKCVGDPARAASLISTLISVVNSNTSLQKCRPETIISAALRGEIGMSLSLALGEYGIVPYGDIATFQLQAKGLQRLAIRSGAYSAIDFFDVREGEYEGRDPRTREPKFNWIDDEDEREKLPIVGYYGFYKLNAEHNGFFRCIYWTHNQILKHADKYSKAFSLKKYNAMISGEMSADEAKRLQNGSPWYAAPDEMAHQKMCIKTIAKQLLGDGLAPKEIIQAIAKDNAQEGSESPVIYGDGFDTFAAPTTVDESTGEIIEAEAENQAVDERTNHSAKSTLKVNKNSSDGEKQATETISSFFGD